MTLYLHGIGIIMEGHYLGGQLSAVKWTGCQMSHGQLSGGQMSRGQMAAGKCRGPLVLNPYYISHTFTRLSTVGDRASTCCCCPCLEVCPNMSRPRLLCLFFEVASRLFSSGVHSHDFYRNFCLNLLPGRTNYMHLIAKGPRVCLCWGPKICQNSL